MTSHRTALLCALWLSASCARSSMDSLDDGVVPDGGRGGRGDGGDGGDGGDAGDDASAECVALTSSGPIVVSADGQIIENLRITSDSGPAISVTGKSNVIIRNVRVLHANGPGISFASSPNIRIENVEVSYTAAPATGALSSANYVNITGYASPDAIITKVKLSHGSSGIYLQSSDRAQLSFVEGHDVRGPLPRGQLVQWNDCHGGSLTDFSVENDLDVSWTEDNVNAFESSGITIQRGLVDGNNAPSGCGIIADEATYDMDVRDVDLLHQGNGCICAYDSGNPPAVHDVSYTRGRCKDSHCGTVQGRPAPASSGLIFAVAPDTYNIQLLDASYVNHCNPNNLIWDASRVSPRELAQQDFTPRAAIRLNQCWK